MMNFCDVESQTPNVARILSFIFSSCPQLHPWQKQSETKLTSRLCLSVCSTFPPRTMSKFTGTYSPRKACRMLLTKRSQLGFGQVRLLYKRHESNVTSHPSMQRGFLNASCKLQVAHTINGELESYKLIHLNIQE